MPIILVFKPHVMNPKDDFELKIKCIEFAKSIIPQATTEEVIKDAKKIYDWVTS